MVSSVCEVRTILKSWRGPGYLRFKVETDYGPVYDLLGIMD